MLADVEGVKKVACYFELMFQYFFGLLFFVFYPQFIARKGGKVVNSSVNVNHQFHVPAVISRRRISGVINDESNVFAIDSLLALEELSLKAIWLLKD